MANSSSESSPREAWLYDLGSQLVVGKTVSGENRKFLAADQGGQSVDGGDSGVGYSFGDTLV